MALVSAAFAWELFEFRETVVGCDFQFDQRMLAHLKGHNVSNPVHLERKHRLTVRAARSIC
jgi:hypothetical protein